MDTVLPARRQSVASGVAGENPRAHGTGFGNRPLPEGGARTGAGADHGSRQTGVAEAREQPYIAPEFLAELIRSLPLLVFYDDGNPYYDYDDNGYEGFYDADERITA